MKKSNSFLTKLAELYKNKNTLVLLISVAFASLLLITINFYTLRITSAVRAYINGESEYSKSQKDALLYLSTYIYTGEEQYYTKFKRELEVPQGDNIARTTLEQHGPEAIIKSGFLKGRNNRDDLDKMIWLFTTFRNVYFMHTAIQEWKEAEPMINECDSMGAKAYSQLQAGTLTEADKLAYSKKINILTEQLSAKERIFSTVLGTAARDINHYLFLVNTFTIILLLSGIIGYAIIMIRRLTRSELKLKANNLELSNINKELDTFVYSASHDLRSPIASLKGLVGLTLTEDEPATRQTYLGLMNGIVDKLDIFIKEIIDFFRNKRTSVQAKKISLQKLLTEAIDLVRFMPDADNISVIKEINADEIYSDELRIKIILNNLISNAIKYSDLKKEQRYVKISTRLQGGDCIITIEDNGLGIKKENHQRIFDMFFVTQNNNKGTGLGLYIVKETIEKLNGHIQLESEINTGSTFIISIPAGN